MRSLWHPLGLFKNLHSYNKKADATIHASNLPLFQLMASFPEQPQHQPYLIQVTACFHRHIHFQYTPSNLMCGYRFIIFRLIINSPGTLSFQSLNHQLLFVNLTAHNRTPYRQRTHHQVPVRVRETFPIRLRNVSFSTCRSHFSVTWHPFLMLKNPDGHGCGEDAWGTRTHSMF